MIFSTLLLVTPFFVQEPDFQVPITHQGADALAAYEAWAEGLPTELEYPVQMYVGFEMSMEMPTSGVDIEMSMHMNSISDSAEALRVWGDFKVHGGDESDNIEWDAEFQAGVNDSGLRFSFDDGGTFADLIGEEIPSGFTLSSDRLAKVSDMYLDVLEAMPEFYGAEVLDAFETISGAGELMHPALWSRYMSYTEGWDVSGWGEKDGLALVELSFNAEEMRASFGGEEMPFDLSSLEGSILNMVVSAKTGTILDWNLEIEFPMDMIADEEGLIGEMLMKMEMKTVPVSDNAPLVEMPLEGVMDLNPYFDEYLPLIEIAMEAMAEEAKRQQGELESEDDFEF